MMFDATELDCVETVRYVTLAAVETLSDETFPVTMFAVATFRVWIFDAIELDCRETVRYVTFAAAETLRVATFPVVILAEEMLAVRILAETSFDWPTYD